MTEQIAPAAGAGTPQPAAGNVTPPATPPATPPVAPAPAPAENNGGVEPNAAKPAVPEPQKPAVPETYDLKLPKDSPLKPDAIERKAADAKARGLTNEQAQKELETESAQIASDREAQRSAVTEAWKKQNEDWTVELKNDPAVGGEKFPQNIELAKRVVTKFGDPTFMKELDETGFGNHPGLVRMLVKLGQGMSEDQLVIPGAAVPDTKRSAAEVLFPTTYEKDK